MILTYPDKKNMDCGRDYSKPKDLTCVRVLGKGGFGTVYLAVHCQLGKVAVKVGRSFSLEEEKMFESEAKRMIDAGRHPSVVSFFGIVDPTTHNSAIIMEFVEHGSLKSFQKNYAIPSACKVQMIRDIASGMCFLHTLRNPIIHRDLKLENIFVDRGLFAKVGDFGLATSCSSAIRVQSGGTPTHIPPESLGIKVKPPTTKFDVFSYGVTIWELYTGKTPYEHAHSALTILQVTTRGNPGLENIPDDTPHFVRQLIEDACDIDADKRPTFQEILPLLEREFKTNYSRHYNKQFSELIAQVDKLINSSTYKDATDGPRARFPWERKQDYPDSSNDSPKRLISVVTPVGTEPLVKIPVPVSDPTPDEYKPDIIKALTDLKITTNQSQEGEKFGMAETTTPDDRDAGGRNISATGVEDQCGHGAQPESGGDQFAVADDRRKESSIQSTSSDHTSDRGHQQTGLVQSRQGVNESSCQEVVVTRNGCTIKISTSKDSEGPEIPEEKVAPPITDSKERVTDKDIGKIYLCIGKDWIKLGRKLGLEEYELEIIEMNNSSYGVQEMAHKMLIQWVRCQVGPSRSRAALAKILWELRLEAAAKKL